MIFQAYDCIFDVDNSCREKVCIGYPTYDMHDIRFCIRDIVNIGPVRYVPLFYTILVGPCIKLSLCN